METNKRTLIVLSIFTVVMLGLLVLTSPLCRSKNRSVCAHGCEHSH